MRFSTVSDWLTFVSSVHPAEIELGLDRVKEIAARLNLLSPSCTAIIVGGTNGKGSCVAGLAAIYRAAGYRVGTFTSPIFLKHNEQVRIDGQEASDEDFCEAFEKIESHRNNISLTPFEYHTLAALIIFKQYPLDVLLLEVGLGGRLDAVNIIDADVAVVTSIDIDHVEWLGLTREEIAREKAGIFRQGKPAVCGDFSPPRSLSEYANQIDTKLFYQGKDFYYRENATHWSWMSQNIRYNDLPLTSLAIQNMATVLMAVELLQNQLPVTREAINQGLATVTLPGRIQVSEGPIRKIFDVAHNPAAVAFLAKQLQSMPCQGKTWAVFSMLADKDIFQSLLTIREVIDVWHIAPLPVKRGASQQVLAEALQKANIHHATFFTSIKEAYQSAFSHAQTGDRLVIFGSFSTVSEVWRYENYPTL